MKIETIITPTPSHLRLTTIYHEFTRTLNFIRMQIADKHILVNYEKTSNYRFYK